MTELWRRFAAYVQAPSGRVKAELGRWGWPLATILSVVAWSFALSVNDEWDATLVVRMANHWLLFAPILVLYMMMAGQIGVPYGIPALFRAERDAPFHLKSPGIWSAFGATGLIALACTMAYWLYFIGGMSSLKKGAGTGGSWFVPPHDPIALTYQTVLSYLAACSPPFVLILMLAALWPGTPPGRERRPARRRYLDVVEYGLGSAAGVVFVFVLTYLAHRASVWIVAWARIRGWIEAADGVLWTFHLRPGTIGLVKPFDDDLVFVVNYAVFFVAVVFVVSLLFLLNVPSLPPGLGVGLLFCLWAGAYFLLASVRPRWTPPIVLACLIYVYGCNINLYKYRIPGFSGADEPSSYDQVKLLRLRDRGSGDRSARPPLDDEEVLGKWAKRVGSGKPREPKLILLAVTGGAYRAAFWVASVVDELEKRSRPGGELEGLTDHIRLITGASGGMVAAAYYTCMRNPGQPAASIVDALVSETKRDSLTPVARQLIQRDIPRVFWPFRASVDRGTVLENQWKTLNHTFDDLREGESAGWRPSLIVSPMIVETGQRMLISNLDLSALAHPAAKSSGFLFENPAQQMFSLFPDAYRNFKVKTAIRLNATFPYISPTVSLPTVPPLRVVDAGYFDNYGVNLAANWAYIHRDWINNNTSGLAILQVYAYSKPRPVGTVNHEKAEGEESSESPDLAFNFLTGPIEGGLASLRWSMLYRNEEQLRLLYDTVKNFETFVFANPGQTVMNWFVSNQDVKDCREAIQQPGPLMQKELSRLQVWWKCGG